MPNMFLQIPSLYPYFKVCCPFKSLNQYQCNLQEKKVQVHELVPMALLDKAEEIVMISLLVLYNTNPVPLAICALPPPVDVEQQGSGVKEKLHEEEISIPTRKKKNRKKAPRGVVIRKVSTRMSSGHLSIPKNFQLRVVGERRLIDDEHPSCDILA